MMEFRLFLYEKSRNSHLDKALFQIETFLYSLKKLERSVLDYDSSLRCLKSRRLQPR